MDLNKIPSTVKFSGEVLTKVLGDSDIFTLIYQDNSISNSALQGKNYMARTIKIKLSSQFVNRLFL